MPNDPSLVRARCLARHLPLLLALFIGLLAAPALAARTVWKQTKIQEEDKSWKISLEVHLDRAPDIAHMPVRFSFTPVSYFERALVDGRKEPITREIPLQHQQPIVESLDVGFLDPGSGKTSKRTRFSFRITRDHGFEAGRYEVKVVDARSDRALGGTTLTLQGDNEVIDRRSMVFDEKKPAPKAEGTAQTQAAPEEKELTPEDEEFWRGGPRTSEEKPAPLPPPAHMREKPGCGCRVAGGSSFAPAWALASLLGSLILRRRRVGAGARA